jgi:hypothetical protein
MVIIRRFFMNLKRKSLSVFLTVLLLTLLAVITVSAAVTWVSVSGPTWITTGYEFTVQANSSSPHHDICILYTIPPAGQTHNLCTGLGNNSWSCVIPGAHANTTIAYQFIGSSNASCTGNLVYGPSGNFSTGPNAIELASFTSVNQPDRSFLVTAAVVGFLVVVVLAGGLFWNRKSRLRG